jgi:hypothetical protein
MARLRATVERAVTAWRRSGMAYMSPARLLGFSAYMAGLSGEPETWPADKVESMVTYLSRMCDYHDMHGKEWAPEMRDLNSHATLGDVVNSLVTLGYDVRTAVYELDALLHNAEALQTIIGQAARHATATLCTLRGAPNALKPLAPHGF